MVFPPDEGSIELKLPLFETTENDSDISLNLNHEILSVGDKAISIAEIYDFENRGNKIYIGKQGSNNLRRTLSFYIPEKAINLKFVEGLEQENITRDKNIAYDSTGFPPGRKRVVLTYEIPLEFGKNQIEKEIIINVSTLLLLVDDDKGMVEVSTLTELEPVNIENKNYKRWSANNLEAGKNYVITVNNTSLQLEYIDLFPIIIFAAIFLSVFIISLISRTENKDNDKKLLLTKRQEIIQQIIVLDQEFNNQAVDENEYNERRNKLKGFIAEIDKIANTSIDHQNETE